MTYPNTPADSDSVNLGSNPGPPATRSADVSEVSRASRGVEQPENSERTAHIGRTEVGTLTFRAELDILTSKHEDAGMSSDDILTGLMDAVVQYRRSLMPSKADDKYSERWLAPMTEAERRAATKTQPYEPTPPQRAENWS